MGLGTIISRMWLDCIFKQLPYIPHVGFTTWSGNVGMMAVGDKLNMTLKARIRSVRYYNNKY